MKRFNIEKAKNGFVVEFDTEVKGEYGSEWEKSVYGNLAAVIKGLKAYFAENEETVGNE